VKLCVSGALAAPPYCTMGARGCVCGCVCVGVLVCAGVGFVLCDDANSIKYSCTPRLSRLSPISRLAVGGTGGWIPPIPFSRGCHWSIQPSHTLPRWSLSSGPWKESAAELGEKS
jgi:hypothetical protein